MGDKTTTTSDVELDVNGQQVSAAMVEILNKIKQIGEAVSGIGKNAGAISKNFDKNTLASMKAISKVAGEIARFEKVIAAQQQGPVRTANREQALARATTQALHYSRELKDAGNAAEALQAKLNTINKTIAGKGLGTHKFDLAKQMNLKGAISETERLAKELVKLDRLSGRTAGSGAFSAERTAVAAARNALFKAATDPRRVTFTTEIDTLDAAQRKFAAALAAQRQERLQALRDERATVEEANRILKETGFQQQGRVRAGASRLGTPSDVLANTSLARAEQINKRAIEQTAAAKMRLDTLVRNGAGNAEIKLAVKEWHTFNGELLQSTRLLNEVAKAERLVAAEAAKAARAQEPAPARQGRVGRAFTNTALYGGAATTIFGAFSAVKDGAKFTIEFEDALKDLQAISGATTTQLEGLSATILTVARDSKFSTIDIAKASTTLAQAGFSVSEMQNALKSVTTLATASGSSPAEAVDLMTAAIGSFQLQASEAARVTDVMVAALNRSKLTVTQVAQAIQYVGATAYEQNISLNQLVATAGALSNAGIRSGSSIGTGLRQFLVDLQSPSEKLTEQLDRLNLSFADVDVKTRGLPAVLTSLKNAGFGAAQAYAGLETRAAATFLVLKNNTDVMDNLMLATAQQGVAAEASGRAMDSLSAQWTRFKNILNESVSGAFAETLKFLKATVKLSADAIEGLARLRKEAAQQKNVLGDIHALSFEPGDALDLLSRGMIQVLDSGVNLGKALGLLDEQVQGLGSRWVEYTNQLVGSSEANDELATKVANATDEVNAQQQSMDALDKEMARLLLQHASLSNNQTLAAAETVTLTSRFAGLAGQLVNTGNKYYDLINAVRAYRAAQGSVTGNLISAQLGAARNDQFAQKQLGLRQIQGIKNSSQFKLLTAQEKAALNAPAQGNNTQILADAAKRLAASAPVFANAMNQLVATAGKVITRELEIDAGVRAAAQNRFSNTPGGRQILDNAEILEARVAELTSTTTGQTPAQRAAAAVAVQSELTRQIKALNTQLAGTNQSPAGREVRQATLLRLQSLQTQVGGIVKPTTAEARDAKRDADKAQREADREARRDRNNEASVDKTGVGAAQKALTEALAAERKSDSLADFEAGQTKVKEAYKLWLDRLNAATETEIAAKGLSPEQADELRQVTAEKIKTQNEAVTRKLDDNLQAAVEVQLKAIDLARTAALAPSERTLALAEASRAGLDNVSNAGRVPDYVRVLADNRVAKASEAAERARIPANQQAIAAKEALLARSTDPNQIATLKNDIETLNRETEALQAKFAAVQFPTTLKDGLNQAIEAFKIANAGARTFKESLINDLGTAVDGVAAGFNTFFDDILSGSVTAGQAFLNFGKSMIRMMQEIAARAIATQLFNFLIGTIGGAAASGSVPSSSSSGPGSPITWTYKGGPIKGYASGGKVNHGVPNRDSVITALARGEYVVRKSAVDSVGSEFMGRLNTMGARALQSAPAVVMPAPARQETNVWVVKQDQLPQLGPNDVKVIIANDILNDGQTKKLIRHVAQGG